MPTTSDFTPSGIKVEGPYENDRNAEATQVLKDMIREAFAVKDVIIAHHLTYVIEDKRADGYTYQVVEEIPSADTLIFDHDVAQKIWGDDFKSVLTQLACEPCDRRDALLAKLYYGRQKA